jgi:hypothetical protein
MIELPYKDFKVLDEPAAKDLCLAEPNEWNVISIYDGLRKNSVYTSGAPLLYNCDGPILTGARSICYQDFNDIRYEQYYDKERVILRPATAEQIIEMLRFAREKRGQRLVTHCWAGISRSSSLGFLILLDCFRENEDAVNLALNYLLHIRKCSYPNRYILNMGIPIVAKNLILPSISVSELETKWFRDLYNNSTYAKMIGH